MSPLARTLTLLALTTATTAIRVVPLDMSPSSFDDQYQGCRDAMTAALPALNRSEFQQNRHLAQAWALAAAEWHSRLSPLSPAQSVALTAYTAPVPLFWEFNAAVREAGRSPAEYRDKFLFKTLHFLLTAALAALRDARGPRCHRVYRGVRGVRFEARPGRTVRFGQFTSTSLSEGTFQHYGRDTEFRVDTCHGVAIGDFSYHPSEDEVLVPPYETFEVTNVTREGDRARIWLRSTGTHSNYNCEWLRGGTVPSPLPHLGGGLLATTVLAVATRTL